MRGTDVSGDTLGIPSALYVLDSVIMCLWQFRCFEKDPWILLLLLLTANGVVEVANYRHLKPFKLYVIAFIPDVHALFLFTNLKMFNLCVFSQAGQHSAADPLKIVYSPLLLLSYAWKQEMGSAAANRPWSRRSSEGKSCWWDRGGSWCLICKDYKFLPTLMTNVSSSLQL